MNPAMCRVCASMLAVAGSAAATALAVGTTALAASAVDQLISTGSINIGSAFETAGIAALTGGLTQGLLGNTGIGDLGNGITDASSSTTLANLGATAENVVGQSLIAAGATNLIEGGSFGSELLASFGQYAAAVGANGIGNVAQEPDSVLAVGSVGYDLAHAALGCAASEAEGTGCAGGAIGGAISAGLNPIIDANGNIPPAVLAGIQTMLSGSAAAALGLDVQGAVTAAQNETLNNWLNHVPPSQMFLSQQQQYDNASVACSGGDAQACATARQLQALSLQNDAWLASACAGGTGSSACQAAVTAALAGGNDVRLINGTVYAFDPNAPAIRATGDPYQTAFGNSFDGQVEQSTAQGLQLAPVEIPGVVAALGMLGEWLGSGAKAAGSAAIAGSAADMTTAAQLRTQLAFQQAGILDASGQLTQQAVQNSRYIPLSGTGEISNPSVVNVLTSDGSNIADWGKYTTQSVTTPNGQSLQIHYYMNSVTGKIDYITPDFKVKGTVVP